MVKIYTWNRTEKVLRTPTIESLCARAQEIRECGDFVWIDLSAPTPEEEQFVFQQFWRIHTLSLEDITRYRREKDDAPHHSKVEEYPDYLFVIVNPLTERYLQAVVSVLEKQTGEVCPYAQLSCVINHNMLVTHHAEPLNCVRLVQDFLVRHPDSSERGPDYVLHLILDEAVDLYIPVLQSVEDSLDGLESRLFHRPKPLYFNQLLRVKREIIHLRKTLIKEREVLVRLARGEFELVNERETVYYRNVYDHLVRFTELIESSREMVSDLMQSHLAATSNHLNQIMKVLTMISTIVLPMTLVAGVYGMNFDHMPELKWQYGYPFALLLMAASGLISLAYFRWKKWL